MNDLTNQDLFDIALNTLKSSWATNTIFARVTDPRYDRSFGERVCRLMFEKCACSTDKYQEALRDFVDLSEEFVVLQMELDRTGRYRYSSFDEVRAVVYDEPTIMEHRYLNGLFLSQAFWPNHTQIFRYFVERFCEGNAPYGRVLEGPSGTGAFISEFNRWNPRWKADAIDLSESSVAFTSAVAKITGTCVRVTKADIFDLPEEICYDRIICGELLEHLENPQALLRKLGRLIAPAGKIFLTTAIWAASIDHIYLFTSTQSVRTMLEECFVIESDLALNVREGCHPEDEATPINYACILAKN